MMEASVRRVRPSDARAVATLRHDALRTAPHAFAMSVAQLAAPDDPWWERLCAHTATGKDALFVVAKSDVLIGMAGFRIDASEKMSHCGMIWGVFVAPAHQQHGYGSLLIHALLDHGAEHRLRMVKLSVTVNQRRAVTLYERLGFIIYAKEPALLYIDNQEIDALHMVYRYPDGGIL